MTHRGCSKDSYHILKSSFRLRFLFMTSRILLSNFLSQKYSFSKIQIFLGRTLRIFLAGGWPLCVRLERFESADLWFVVQISVLSKLAKKSQHKLMWIRCESQTIGLFYNCSQLIIPTAENPKLRIVMYRYMPRLFACLQIRQHM